MTQPITRDGVTILLDLPESEKKESRHVQPSYVKACQGDERAASVLDYFVYAASREVKDKGLKGCNVVTLTRTHDEILKGLQNKPSEKSLIRYLKMLKGCKFVLSVSYKRDFEVHLDTIQEAVNNPPPPKIRKPRQKGCKVEPLTRVQPSEDESEKVVMLQLKVDMLQLKVEQLQPKVDMLQRYNPVFERLAALLEGTQNNASLLSTSILPLSTSNSNVAANADDTPSPLSSSQENADEDMDITDFAIQVSLDNWAKRFESMYRSQLSTQQASNVDNPNDPHTGQLADSSTVSDMPASSDGVTLETPLPSQANNDMGKNLPSQKTLSDASTGMPLSQMEVTSQNEVLQASNGQSPIAAVATRNPGEEHAPLSRSGESVTESFGVRQEAPKRIRKKAEKPPLPALTDEERQLRKDVQAWVDGKRGYKLYGRATAKDIHTERQNAWTLAHMLYVRLYEQNEEEGCTWEDLEYTHEYCCKRDKFWSQPDNRVRIGTFAILQKFAVAMALKVQEPIDLEDRRNGVHKQTALGHGSRPQAYGLVSTEELREDPWKVSL